MILDQQILDFKILDFTTYNILQFLNQLLITKHFQKSWPFPPLWFQAPKRRSAGAGSGG